MEDDLRGLLSVEALHVYCVGGDGTETRFGPIGLLGREVFAVQHADLAAIVSRSPVRAYAAMAKHEVVPFLFAHQAVIEKVMDTRTVVPVKFGTTARNAAAVRTILARGHAPLTAALAAMEGRIELDVVAAWRDLNRALLEVAGREEIEARRAAIASRPFGQTREERIELGRLLKAQVDQLREQRAAEILEALTSLAETVRPHALVDERMILNTALLVQRSREPEVDRSLNRLNEQYGDAINFRCVGPLPPYSFSTVEVRSFDFRLVDRARKLLGLGERAGLPAVKGAYRRLAWGRHPDGAGPGEGGRGFDELAAAYRILSEYCEAGGRAFREREVDEAVAVHLFQWESEAQLA